MFGLITAVSIEIDLLSPFRELVAASLIGGPLLIAHFLVAPRLLTLRRPEPNESIEVFDEDAVDEEPQLTPEQIEALQPMIDMQNPDSAVGIQWRCKSCGETNDKEFRLCWNCSDEYGDSD